MVRGVTPSINKYIPICLLVCSTIELRLTFDKSPRQNLSDEDGSVNPSTVSEG